ncbi:hypothetical protein GCM10007304_19220 [Rhodococcoides trifolii]|uniref:Uncharacterized protein n=1 Tax=Rhodococcoides trifolii TaxID=908250 RepID=A0A917FU40_9NOCA|nr:hypothetical protein [Rhodococcus trifolii]GGG05285.1 hypothetical protein GCM10007304_19220 [Rhodococcus trifolii]
MSSGERDLAADFRVLVETVLDRLEPVIRRLDEGAGTGAEWQGCSWCPLCAAAAFLKGERHDLLSLAGGEMEQILTLVRDLLGEHVQKPASTDPVAHQQDSTSESAAESQSPIGAPTGWGEARRKRTYEPITVTVKE